MLYIVTLLRFYFRIIISFLVITYVALLAYFENKQVLPKNARQSSRYLSGRGESKKQLQDRTICTTKPETQWFCEGLANILCY